MSIEIDFLNVGEASRSGDAIAIRYGNLLSGYEVMIVDGGDKAAGERLVEHVKRYFGTDNVAHVVNTHPDGDHASGLSVVLEQLKVGRLWMHRPWNYAEDIRHLFADGRITDNSLEQTIRDALQAAHDLEELALSKGIPMSEPFQGQVIGPFIVLSPNQTWYLNELVPQFRGTPEPKLEGLAATIYKALTAAVQKVGDWVDETLDYETLKEGVERSAENESSVVLYGVFDDGKKVLLTGDAGCRALERANSFAAVLGWRLDDLWLMQIPHHGGRHNVGPTILNKIKAANAVASAAKDDENHPRRVVTNAFRRRGTTVKQTKGNVLSYQLGIERPGWTAAPEVPFFDKVEA